MKSRALGLSLVLLLLTNSTVFAQDDLAAKADASAHRVTDAAEFVAGLQRSVVMARRGEYGKISKDDLKKVEQAKDDIARLLEGHEQATELDTEDRIRLYNASQLISATLNNEDKRRKICKREAEVGSRLSKTVCMTIAQREARAKQARYETNEIQKQSCAGAYGSC